MRFIMVLFHLAPFKHFKAFYHYGIGQHIVPALVKSYYDHFISLMRRLFAPLMILLHSLSGKHISLYFVDLTKLTVCHNRFIHRYTVF